MWISGHPWLVGSHELKIPCDMIIYKLVKVYIMSTSLRKSALVVSWNLRSFTYSISKDINCMINVFFFFFFSWLQALAKTLTVPQLAYLREQFTLLGPSKNGYISMQNYKTVSYFCLQWFHLSPFGILYDFLMFFIQISGNFKERNRCYEGFKSHRFCSHGKKQEANYIHLIVKSFV